jgi:hypothetical protein
MRIHIKKSKIILNTTVWVMSCINYVKTLKFHQGFVYR